MKKVASLSLFFISFIIIFLNFANAAPCPASDQTILKYYAATNSHAATPSSSGAPLSICYNNIFGTTYTYPSSENPNSCSAGNANGVLSLSSLSNAHVGDITAYPTPICYGDLSCTIATGTAGITTDCPVGYSFITSISSTSNAHIATDGTYATKICCKRAAAPPAPVCAATHFNCQTGTSSNQQTTSSQYTWICTSGSNTISCSEAITSSAINGVCGSTKDTCAPGDFSDLTDTSSNYQWQCLGSGGGTNSPVCTAPITGSVITDAKWQINGLQEDTFNIQTNSVDDLELFGALSSGYPSGANFVMDVFDLATPFAPVKSYSSSAGTIARPAPPTLSAGNNKIQNVIPNYIRGNSYQFNLYEIGSSNPPKKSNVLTIISSAPNLDACEKITDATICAATTYSGIKFATSVSLSGSGVCTSQTTTTTPLCTWTSSGCRIAAPIVTTSSGTEVAKCIISVSSPSQAGACVNGKRTITFTGAIQSSSGCSGSCSICNGNSCQVPCGRAIADLPFFTFVNLAIAILLIVGIYLVIKRKDIFNSLSKKNRKKSKR